MLVSKEKALDIAVSYIKELFIKGQLPKDFRVAPPEIIQPYIKDAICKSDVAVARFDQRSLVHSLYNHLYKSGIITDLLEKMFSSPDIEQIRIGQDTLCLVYKKDTCEKLDLGIGEDLLFDSLKRIDISRPLDKIQPIVETMIDDVIVFADVSGPYPIATLTRISNNFLHDGSIEAQILGTVLDLKLDSLKGTIGQYLSYGQQYELKKRFETILSAKKY